MSLIHFPECPSRLSRRQAEANMVQQIGSDAVRVVDPKPPSVRRSVSEARIPRPGYRPVNRNIGVDPPKRARKAVLIADLMVDLDAPIGIIAWLVRTIDIVIVICGRNIRRREQFPSSLGDGADFARWDEVVGECVSDEASRAIGPCGGRIKDREGVIGEISISFLHGGNCHQAACRESAAQPEAGIGEKER